MRVTLGLREAGCRTFIGRPSTFGPLPAMMTILPGDAVSKRDLSERDICTKFLTPAILGSGWDLHTQIREEYPLTKGRIIVRGKLVNRAAPKRADYVLFRKPGLPIAVVEAKDNTHTMGDGMQQALSYAELDVPFAFSSNGDGFLLHDMTGSAKTERTLSLDKFPSPDDLWNGYRSWKGLSRIDAHLGKDGLTEGDVRALADTVPMNLWRPNVSAFEPFEPFEPLDDRTLTVLVIGETKAAEVERRYVLILDHHGDQLVVADPAGPGLTTVARTEFNEARKVGAVRGRPWVGLVGAR
jgi:hypothetical protein